MRTRTGRRRFAFEQFEFDFADGLLTLAGDDLAAVQCDLDARPSCGVSSQKLRVKSVVNTGTSSLVAASRKRRSFGLSTCEKSNSPGWPGASHSLRCASPPGDGASLAQLLDIGNVDLRPSTTISPFSESSCRMREKCSCVRLRREAMTPLLVGRVTVIARRFPCCRAAGSR
jgi:hypothetical protein